jgi:hypothetical protein
MADRSIFPLQQAAQTALNVQDAINLSGVVRSLDEIVRDVLWPEAHRQSKGTRYVNQHAIVTLFLHKLTSLNNSDCFCSDCLAKYNRAVAEVERIAGGITDESNGSGAL